MDEKRNIDVVSNEHFTVVQSDKKYNALPPAFMQRFVVSVRERENERVIHNQNFILHFFYFSL